MDTDKDTEKDTHTRDKMDAKTCHTTGQKTHEGLEKQTYIHNSTQISAHMQGHNKDKYKRQIKDRTASSLPSAPENTPQGRGKL